ncbi:hypothetical protein AwPolaro_09560 [Polaromonas sp.]|nr:hypothetical protein AwPolaro_09560 [Polaromonas sp.]
MCVYGFALWAGLAAAQMPPEAPPARSLDSERSKIALERDRLQAGFLTEDGACYKRFAVNACLEKVDIRRRQAMADLRRQENLLNDEERQTRGLEQLSRTEEKSSPEKLEEARLQRAQAAADYQSRLDKQKIKQQERAAVPLVDAAADKANADKQSQQQKNKDLRAARPAAEAAQREQYDARQKQAETRRAQYESELQSRPKSTVQPLPLPE